MLKNLKNESGNIVHNDVLSGVAAFITTKEHLQ